MMNRIFNGKILGNFLGESEGATSNKITDVTAIDWDFRKREASVHTEAGVYNIYDVGEIYFSMKSNYAIKGLSYVSLERNKTYFEFEKPVTVIYRKKRKDLWIEPEG